MHEDLGLMAARRLAHTLDDRQRALLIAMASRPDAAVLMAEAAGESERYARFGVDRLDADTVVLLNSLDHVLAHCHSKGRALAKRIHDQWDDMSSDLQSRIAERVEAAIERDEPGVAFAPGDWQSIVDLSLGARPRI